MDLFSGSFGCFKSAGKGAEADLENDQKAKDKIKIWVLRCSRTGDVHYLEAYKDFVDVLLGFLMLRTGALIRLNRAVSPAMKRGMSTGGVYGVYDSFERLDDSVVLVDREILLDPHERLKVSEELQALDSGDFECCNADCFKYLSGSRQICRSCTISTHFSCVVCGGYFRENAHTSLCYTPWRPWRNHMTAAPVLTRYTVIQSCPRMANKPKLEGYVRNNIPFIITNELIISPLSTSNVAEILKTCGAGSCEDLECNELSIGTPEVLVMLGAALTSSTPLTDIYGKMCNEKTRVSCSGSGASFSQFPSCKKKSTFGGDQDGSSIKISTSITSCTVPHSEKVSQFHNNHDSSRRRPTTTPCVKLFSPCRKKSKSPDHDDSLITRPPSITSSALPPSEKVSRSRRGDGSSISRLTSGIKHAVMNQTDSPYQSPRQSRRESPRELPPALQQQVQEQRAVETQTECTPCRSSFRRKSSQKKLPRKISFQQQPNDYQASELEPDCLGYVCPSPPRSPRAIVSESSFIELSNFDKTPQRQQHLPRKSSCTSSSSRSSTPEAQSVEQISSPIRRPSTLSTEQVIQQTPLTRRPGSVCPIDECAQVSSPSIPLQLNSTRIINPLFQQASPTDNTSISKSSPPPTSPPSRALLIKEDESLPCVSRHSRNVSNIQHRPKIVHRSYSPVGRQTGVTNTRPAVRFRKSSAGIGIASLASVAAAFEQGSNPSYSNSDVGSISSDGTEYSDDSTTN